MVQADQASGDLQGVLEHLLRRQRAALLQHRLLDRWRHEQGAGAVRFGAVPRLSAKPLPPRSFNSLPLSGSRNQNQTLIITNR